MEAIGLAFAIIAETRTLVEGIFDRISNYRQGPETFKALKKNLDHLTQNIDEVDDILRASPNVLPERITGMFNRVFSRVRENLQNSSAIVENDFSYACSTTGFLNKVKFQINRVVRATSLRDKMVCMEMQIREASSELSHLTTVLATSLKVDEQQSLFNSSEVEGEKEEYRSAVNVPALPHTVNLDFCCRDARGNCTTPEGMLKQKVFSRIFSRTATVVPGSASVTRILNPVYGVVGMAGVGKTTALQGLAADEEIFRRFPDGVHYMSFLHGASNQDAIREIAKIMRMTGAVASLSSVESATSLEEAVDYAVEWFEGKVCLFLVDDLWPTEDCTLGYLNELRQLLRGNPDSRMVVSTRSVPIALGAGSVVDFGARDPLGPISVKIFMTYATGCFPSCTNPGGSLELSPSVSEILMWCGGLPIALSVTGCAVALLLRTVGSFERACEIYAADFEQRKRALGSERVPGGKSLAEGIFLSLKYLQVEFLHWKSRKAVEVEHSIADLYTSFCVLTDQLWVPISVLSRMWKLDEHLALDVVNLFCGMSLATLSFRKTPDDPAEKCGLTLHDLHLDFCKRQAHSKNSESLWHSALLNGYLKAPSDLVGRTELGDLQSISSEDIIAVTPRPWWSTEIVDDSYIHMNVARHLSLSNMAIELAALLLDARWANKQGKIGGLLGLRTDFDIVDTWLSKGVEVRETNTQSNAIRQGFKMLLKALQISWGRFSDGRKAFQYQVCGRLLSLRRDSDIVDTYTKSFGMHTPKPCLMPTSNFYPDLGSAQLMEIPAGGWCGCVTCSSCGRYLAVGAGRDILVADATTGDIVKRLQGHIEHVLCITFTLGSHTIVTGSEDTTVIVWEWETSETPVVVLKGHNDCVTGVAVSGEGKDIFSVSYDGSLKLWDSSTGLQTGELLLRRPIYCIDICSSIRKLAVGLGDGTVIVVDSHTGQILAENGEAHDDCVTSVSFSPDGTLLATGSDDCTIRLWRSAVDEALKGHEDCVTSVAFSCNGQQLVSASDDGTIRLWDIAHKELGRAPSTVPFPRERAVLFSDAVRSVSLTCDGTKIISGSSDGFARIWDAKLNSKPKRRQFGHAKSVTAVSMSTNGLLVASASLDKTVRLWDAQTGTQVGFPLRGHTRAVNCVSFSPDGRYVVSGSYDDSLRLWDTEKCLQIGTPFEGHSNGVRCVSFSFDGNRILSGGIDKTVRVWNVETRDQIGATLVGHIDWVTSVSESLDGRFVVSRDYNSNTIIWNRACSEIVWKLRKKRKSKNSISDKEAENIIRSCGQEVTHGQHAQDCSSVVYCEDSLVFSSVLGKKMLLGHLPLIVDWKYNARAQVFTAGLSSGAVAICRFHNHNQSAA